MSDLNTSSPADAQALKAAWANLKSSEPDLRALDIAQRLGVSEAELVACRVGDGIISIKADTLADVFRALPEVGRVMVLTRNHACVHEKKGWFEGVHLGKNMGPVVGGAIDLRVFLNHFKYGFFVNEQSKGKVLDSIQFFDADGVAVHKVYKIAQTNEQAWQNLINTFKAAEQSTVLVPEPVADPLPFTHADAEVDAQALRESWANMSYGPHEVYGVLKKHQVTRLQALRLIGEPYARKADINAAELILNDVVKTGLPIMVFTGSQGLVQIHSGPVRNIKKFGDWLNVLDEDFNLHLRVDQIAEVWIVKKATADGDVTSVEFYDANGLQIVQFFGQRLPGRPEIKAWTNLADSLADTAAIAA